jgi:hypothetical protein
MLVLVTPVATLLHEIGHACAARARLNGAVGIRVGNGPPRWQFSLAGVDVGLRPVVVPFGVTGACEYDAGDCRASDAAVIALAGPLASLIGATASYVAWSHTDPRSLLGAALWQATMLQAGSFVLCLLPLTITQGGAVHHMDGKVALDALRRLTLGTPRSARVRSRPAHVFTPTRAASPDCVACGHPRSEHVDLATGARGACRGQDEDFQTLSATMCTCLAYAHGPR